MLRSQNLFQKTAHAWFGHDNLLCCLEDFNVLWFRKQPREKPPIEPKAPSTAELARFYAQLSEQAEIESVEKTLQGAQANGKIFLTARSKTGEIAGILRAWRDNTDAKAEAAARVGIVYEIAVSTDRRGQGDGRALLEDLRERYRGEHIVWMGNPSRVAANVDRDLSLIRNLYGIALIFGFQKVVESGYLQVTRDPGAAPVSAGEKALLLALALVITGAGIRFFWAVGNIKRCVLERILKLDPPRRWVLVVIHFPILFLHAVLFFFLCRYFQDMCMRGIRDSYARGYIVVYIILLLLNVLWLRFLMYKRTDKGPEWVWIRNNGVFAVAGIVALIIFDCHALSTERQLSIASGLFLLNSIVDFIKTRGAYILRDAFGGG